MVAAAEVSFNSRAMFTKPRSSAPRIAPWMTEAASLSSCSTMWLSMLSSSGVSVLALRSSWICRQQASGQMDTGDKSKRCRERKRLTSSLVLFVLFSFGGRLPCLARDVGDNEAWRFRDCRLSLTCSLTSAET
jgi:hypothetical protein